MNHYFRMNESGEKIIWLKLETLFYLLQSCRKVAARAICKCLT